MRLRRVAGEPRIFEKPRAAASRQVARGMLGAFLGLALVLPFVASWWARRQEPRRLRPFTAADDVGAGIFGTDALGRDVAVRLAETAPESVYLPLLATAALLGLGVAAGIGIGLSPPLLRAAALRVVDFVLVLPPMVLLLVVLAGLGGTPAAMVVAVIAIGWASVTRLLAMTTAQVSASAYFEAARAAGLGYGALIVGEVWPSLRRLVAAEGGLRLIAATQLIAVTGFLGFGSSDSWGAMVHEGIRGVGLNPWAVLAPCGALLLFLLFVAVLVEIVVEGGRRR